MCIGISGLFAYQIKTGNKFDVQSYVDTVEKSAELDELKERLKEIEENFHAYRVKSIYEDVKNVSKRVDAITKSESSHNDKINVDSKKKYESNYDKLVSLPALNELMRVFQSRLNSYYEFVLTNRWPTLSRISRKMTDRFEGIQQKNKARYNYQLTRNSLKLIKGEINQLELVTTRSRLKDGEKKAILSRVEPMKKELNQIVRYLRLFNQFENNTKNYFKSLNSWAVATAPIFEQRKLEFHSEANDQFYYLIGFGVLCLMFAGFGIYLFKREEKHNQAGAQKNILSMVRNEVLNENHQNSVALFDEEFQGEIQNLKKYSQKRMKLGKVLNVTSPFPMFILDQDLQITWANKHFKNLFSLNDNFEITWDYFRKNTNLGDSDPINAAIVKDVAGIYQIQLRTIQDDKPMPFEIYVSPTSEYDEKRVVVWFYNLQSLQDTMTDQAKSIVGPVSRMLDNLLSDQYSKDFEQSIKSDFSIAGIDELFGKFKAFTEKMDIQKSQLLNYIDSLEEEVFDLSKGLNQFNDNLKDVDIKHREISKYIDKVKNNFIKIVNYNEKIDEIERSMFSSSEKQTAIMNLVQQNLQNFFDFIQSVSKFENSLGEIRDGQKSATEYVSLVKLLMKKVQRSNNKLEAFEENFEEMTENLALIEKQFTRGQKSCDVLISKLDILVKGLPSQDLLSTKNDYMNVYDDIKMRNMDFQAINGSIFDIAEATVENFTKMIREMNTATRDSFDLIEKVDNTINAHNDQHSKLIETNRHLTM